MQINHASKGSKDTGASGESHKQTKPGATPATPVAVDEAELSYIAGVTARDHSVVVEIGEHGGGSYASLETKHITLDPEHVSTEAQARFVAAHEGAHIGETPSLAQVGKATEEQRKEYGSTIGLHPLVNVIEDGAINDRFCQKFPNLQPDTLASYPKRNAGDPIGMISLPEVQAIAALTGKPPLFAQGLAGLLADWSELRHKIGFGHKLERYQSMPRQGAETQDPKLKDFFDQCVQEARRAISFIPGPDGTAADSLEMGLKRFTWSETVLYPQLKKLVDDDLASLKQSLKSGAKQQQDQNGKKNQSKGNGSGKGQQTKDSSQDSSGGSSEQGTDQESQKKDEKEGSAKGGKLSDSEAARQAKEMIAKADDAIRKILESLKEKAEGSTPSASDEVAAQNQKEREAEAAQEAAKRGASIAKQLRDAMLASLTPYHQEYHKISQAIDEAYNRLVDVFDPERHFKWMQDLPAGNRLKLEAAMRFELTGEGHERMWMKRIDPRYPDQDIVVIIDRSGSMEGKFEAARSGMIFARELFQRLNIPTACVGFADSASTSVEFEDDISDPDVQKSLMNKSTPLPQGTNDAGALKYAAKLLRERGATRKAIVMLSDAASGVQDLKKVVRDLADEGIPVLHFGLGDGTSDTAGNYINSWGDLSLDEKGDRGFFQVFCREMERLAEGALELGN